MKNQIKKKPTPIRLKEQKLTHDYLYHPDKNVQEAAWKELIKLKEMQNDAR